MLHQSSHRIPPVPLFLVTIIFVGLMAVTFAIAALSVSAQLQSASRKANGKIAFVSNRDGVEKIYVMNPDGSGLVKLTDGPHHLQPSWSPDGTQIAFMGLEKDATALLIMNADGSNRRLVANNIFHNVEAVWSPDGSKIAFGSVAGDGASDSKFSVHVINADGSNEVQVIKGSGSVAWSPDGKELAVATFRGINLVSADGTNRRKLAELQSWFPNYLSWSPDGTKILFGSSRPVTDHAKGTSRYTIEMIAADGSNGKESVVVGYGRDASWSPDGSKIVFIRTSPGSAASQIWVMDADGKNQTQLTDVGPNWRPSWQPLLAASRN